MSYLPGLVFVGQHSCLRDRLAALAAEANCPFVSYERGEQALTAAGCESWALFLVSEQIADMDAVMFCRRIKDVASFPAPYILLLAEQANQNGSVFSGPHDDILPIHVPQEEFRTALRLHMQLAQMRQERDCLRGELTLFQNAFTQQDAAEQDTTQQLVEMAALLQSEVYRQEEAGERNVRSAQVATIAQAATTLQHEINNPLFAISGSAESALRRLRALAEQGVLDVQPIITGVERIQRGADRIGQVVKALGDTLTPVTRDYVPGVSMLELQKPEERK